jgi:hypothetical protein
MSSRQGIVEQGGETRSDRFLGDPRARRRGGRSRPPMTIRAILAWADEHRRLTGRWPRFNSEPKGLPIGETWVAIQSALSKGMRGLEGGSLLAEQGGGLRGALSPKRILAWTDAHHAATGRWPTRTSGRVRGVEGENWRAIDYALLLGRRGLPEGSSLPRLLAESRPVRNVHTLPRLTVEQVLAGAESRTRALSAIHRNVGALGQFCFHQPEQVADEFDIGQFLGREPNSKFALDPHHQADDVHRVKAQAFAQVLIVL